VGGFTGVVALVVVGVVAMDVDMVEEPVP